MIRYAVWMVMLLALLPSLVRSAPLSAEEFARAVGQLQDADAKVRLAAVQRLGAEYDPQAVEPLLGMRQDADPAVRLAVVEALVHTDSHAASDLLALFKDADPGVRAAAIHAAGISGDLSLVDPLFAALPDKDARVRAAAAYGLGHTYDTRVLEPLRILLEDDSPEVRAAAAYALGELFELPKWVQNCPQNFLYYLQSPQQMDAATRERMQAALQGVKWEQTKDMLAKLLDDKASAVRAAAIISLKKLRDPRAEPLLIEGLKNTDRQHRIELFRMFMTAEDAKMTEAGIALLPDETDTWVLSTMVEMLGFSRDRRVVDPLLNALPNKNAEVRMWIMWALGWYYDPRIADAVRPYLKDDSPKLRGSAAVLLGKQHDAQSLELLLPMMEDTDATVRVSVATALSYYRDPRVTKLLLTILPDPAYAQSRSTIIMQLSSDAESSLIDAVWQFRNDHDLRLSVFNTLARCTNPHAGELLRSALQDDDRELQEPAVNAILGSCKGEALASALAVLLQGKNVEFRNRALETLWAMNEKAAVEPLRSVLKDPVTRVRLYAISRLASLGDKRALPDLQALVGDDPEADVRSAALQAVVQLGGVTNDLFLTVMKGSDTQNKLQVMDNLRNCTDPRIVHALIAASADTDNNVRSYATSRLDPEHKLIQLDPVLAALKDPEARIRASAARLLHISRFALVTDALLAALHDPDAEVRVAVVQSLGWARDSRIIDPLLPLLADPSPEVRAATVSTLDQYDVPRVTRAMLPLLKDNAALVRFAAYQAFGWRFKVKPVEALFAMAHDPDAGVRVQVLHFCHDTPGPRAMAILCEALQDPDNSVCHAAAYWLRTTDDPQVAAAMLSRLKALAKDEQAILEVAKRDDEEFIKHPENGYSLDEPMTAMIRKALYWKLSTLIGPALDLLRDANPLQRALGAAVLVHVNDPRTFAPLDNALLDTDALVRRVLARALHQQWDNCSQQALINALEDPSAAVCAEAALALGEIQDTRSIPALLPLLQAKQADVQYAAVWALDRIADPAAVAPLLALYPKTTDVGLRDEIVSALAHIADPRATDLLLAVLKDGTLRQRCYAARALGALKEIRAVEALCEIIKDPPQRPGDNEVEVLPFGLSVTDDGGISGIRSLGYALPGQPKFGQGTLCSTAVQALGAIADPRAIDPLLALLRNPYVDWNHNTHFFRLSTSKFIDLHAAAARALANIRDDRVARILVTQASAEANSIYRETASATALVDSPNCELAIPLMVEALKDPNYNTRLAILNAVQYMATDHRAPDGLGGWIPVPARKDPRFIEPLLALMSGKTPIQCSQEVFTLGMLGDLRATEPLLALMKERYPDMRASAVRVLVTLKDPRALPALQALLSDKDAQLRQSAIEVIAALPDAGIANVLADALADTDAEVRRRAALALCRLGDTRGLYALLGPAYAPWPMTPHVDTLATLTTLPADDTWYHRRTDPVLMLLNTPPLPPLTADLLPALAGMDDPRTVAVMLDLLNRHTEGDERAALLALWHSEVPDTTEILLGRIRKELAPAPGAGALPPRRYSRTLDLLSDALRSEADGHPQAAGDQLPGKLNNSDLFYRCLSMLDAAARTPADQVHPLTPYSYRGNMIWLQSQYDNATTVQALIKILDTGTLEERKDTVSALGALHDLDAVEPLVTALGHVGGDARPAVAKALTALTGVNLGTDAAQWEAGKITRTLARLHDKDVDKRLQMAQELRITFVPEMVTLLSTVLHDPDPRIRVLALEALGNNNHLLNYYCPTAKPEMLTLLQDPDVDVRTAAARAVGYPDNLPAVDPLLKLCSDPVVGIRAAAVHGLCNTRQLRVLDTVRAMLKDASPEVRISAANGLGDICYLHWMEEMPDGWLTYVQEDPQQVTPESRKKIEALLLQLGWEQSLTALAKLLQDNVPAVRAAAASALGMMHDRRIIAPLLALANDDDAQVRQRVVGGLQSFTDPRLTRPLLAMLTEPKNRDLRWNIILALEKNADATVIDPVMQYKDDPQLQREIFLTLAHCRDARATRILLDMVKNTEAHARWAATQALHQLDGPEVVAALVGLLKDADDAVRRGAVEALQGKKDPAAIDPLIAALKDADVKVRMGAITNLTELQAKHALPALQALAKDDPDATVRSMAREATTVIGNGN